MRFAFIHKDFQDIFVDAYLVVWPVLHISGNLSECMDVLVVSRNICSWYSSNYKLHVILRTIIGVRIYGYIYKEGHSDSSEFRTYLKGQSKFFSFRVIPKRRQSKSYPLRVAPFGIHPSRKQKAVC